MTRLFMLPRFRHEDAGNGGGIRRVVEAQHQYLPDHGFEFVDDYHTADVIATHGGDFVPAQHGQLVVSHCHGLYWDEYSWSKGQYELNRMVVRALKQADLITAPSEWVADIIRRGMLAPVSAVPNGIDTTEWSPCTPEARLDYILWNKSRIDPICEIDSLVQLARIDLNHKYVSTLGPAQNIPANMQVVGIQPYGTLHDSAAKVLVQRAGVYLCTTRETFGIGTLEALACGVPIVGWHWGGQAEFIQHKVHGWLCTPGDVEGLREGIEWALAHRDAISDACIELAKQYEWSGIIEQYAKLYQRSTAVLMRPVRCSIVVPSYNLGAYLPQTIASAAAQSCQGNFEILIVDDNSTDGSYEVAKQLEAAYKPVRVVQTPKNLYLAGALNYGISQARGAYIMPLDADNLLEPNTLNVLSSTLDTDRSVDIAYGRVRFITDSGAIDTNIAPDGISGWPPLDFSYSEQLSHKNQIPSTSLYRRKVWAYTGGYRVRCRTAEDADFWCRAAIAGFTARRVTNQPTLIYRAREGQMSQVNKDWPWHLWYAQLATKPGFGVDPNRVPTNEPVLVSVVIPVGPHHADIVHDALDSLYAQTFSKWECIVINDTGHELNLPAWVKTASTGAAGGAGASAARNIGIDLARGVVFMPLDADDFLDSTALEKMWAAYQQHKGYVYCDFVKAASRQTVHVGANACEHVYEMMPHPLTGLYPIQAWRDVGGFEPTLKVGEDWAFVAGCTAHGYCGTYISESLVYYRTESGGNREALLANIDPVRALITQRYGELMVKQCGCSKGGGATMQSTAQNGAQNSTQGRVARTGVQMRDDSLVKLSVKIPDLHSVLYVGLPTGTRYFFSSTGQRAQQYVHATDAEFFIQNMGHIFEYVD